MQVPAGTCNLCDKELTVDAPMNYASEDTRERRVMQHVMEEHTELERAKYKLGALCDRLPAGERVRVAKDIYTSLRTPSDVIGVYTIDEVLGTLDIHRFYQTAVRHEAWVS